MKEETTKYFRSITARIDGENATSTERWLAEIERAEEIRRTSDRRTSMNIMAPNRLAHGINDIPEDVEMPAAPTDLHSWLRFGLHVESQQ